MPRKSLKEGGRSTGGPASHRVLNGFIVAQTALAIVLLVGAGLMLQNFQRLQHRPLGFEPRQLLTIEFTPSTASYPPGPARTQLMHRVIDEIQRAGVAAAGATIVNPLGGGDWGAPVNIEGRGTGAADDAYNVNHRLISPALFQAMRIPLRARTDLHVGGRRPTAAGRDRQRRDGQALLAASGRDRQAPADRAAKHAVAHRRRCGRQRVRRARSGRSARNLVLPYAQQASAAAAQTVHLMIRTEGEPLSLAPQLQRAVAQVDPALATYGIAAMDSYFSQSLRRERLGAGAMIAFAAFGLLLAALGIYAVIAFAVAQRTQEIGLRMALGAEQRSIVRMVLRRGLGLGVVGLALGAAAAVVLNRLLVGLLAEITPLEPVIVLVAAALLLTCIFLACYVPARRAARLDPLIALRAE